MTLTCVLGLSTRYEREDNSFLFGCKLQRYLVTNPQTSIPHKQKWLHSTSQTAWSTLQHFISRIRVLFSYVTRILTRNYRMPWVSGMFSDPSSNPIFIPVTWLTADSCHARDTQHGSNLSIVYSYITFPSCISFITLTIIMSYNTVWNVKRNIFFFHLRLYNNWVNYSSLISFYISW